MVIETKFSIGDVVFVGTALGPTKRVVCAINPVVYAPIKAEEEPRITTEYRLGKVREDGIVDQDFGWSKEENLRTREEAQESFRKAAFDAFLETFDDKHFRIPL